MIKTQSQRTEPECEAQERIRVLATFTWPTDDLKLACRSECCRCVFAGALRIRKCKLGLIFPAVSHGNRILCDSEYFPETSPFTRPTMWS